jgi:hypothetical protein|tara:strand:- start:1023 stop:1250 length:228 start_codon:yes stop_codon:yes gene_type:complete
MNRLKELAGRLRHIEAGIATIRAELDQTQSRTPCPHCGIKSRANVAEYYASVALEGGMTRIRRAADGLQAEGEQQ